LATILTSLYLAINLKLSDGQCLTNLINHANRSRKGVLGMNFDFYLKKVVNGERLSFDEAYRCAEMLLHDDLSIVKAAAFLGSVRTRKESYEELAGFVAALYEEAVVIETDGELMDIVGTGGDGLGTFNISTATALVVAACGVPVAKHGNRAASGKVGSADVLEALGVNIQLTPVEAVEMLEKTGMTFLFAQNYHPILKQVGSLRREMGVPCIFNFLGPLLNPCKPNYQLIGVSDPFLQEAVANAAIKLGKSRVMVVCADNGMDEISPFSSTKVFDAREDGISSYDIKPAELGRATFTLEEILGGNNETNAQIVKDVTGGIKGPHREAVLLNAAAALVTIGRANNLIDAICLAEEAIDSGEAERVLKNMISYSRDKVLAC
jgi:anthranilate phosphoribosyltransferase